MFGEVKSPLLSRHPAAWPDLPFLQALGSRGPCHPGDQYVVAHCPSCAVPPHDCPCRGFPHVTQIVPTSLEVEKCLFPWKALNVEAIICSPLAHH